MGRVDQQLGELGVGGEMARVWEALLLGAVPLVEGSRIGCQPKKKLGEPFPSNLEAPRRAATTRAMAARRHDHACRGGGGRLPWTKESRERVDRWILQWLLSKSGHTAPERVPVAGFGQRITPLAERYAPPRGVSSFKRCPELPSDEFADLALVSVDNIVSGHQGDEISGCTCCCPRSCCADQSLDVGGCP